MKKGKRKGILAALLLLLCAAAVFSFNQKRDLLPDDPGTDTEETEGCEENLHADDEAGEAEAEEPEENAEEETDVGVGGGDHSTYPDSHGGGEPHGGQGQEEDHEPAALYDYFEEGGRLICKGCFMPFADIYALNAHSCPGTQTYECEHEWEAEYNDVWVAEKGHYEYGLIAEAYEEPVYEERCVCKRCGEYFLTSEEAADHIITAHGNEGSWTVTDVVVGYVHHDAVYGEVFIVDEEGHWERVIYRYRCRKCGELKYPD